MVLEKLYTADYIHQHKPITFILGVAYAVCGISFSLFLFPQDPALIAIAFISLFTVVSLSDLLIYEKKAQLSALPLREFLKENRDIFVIFSYLFLGVLFTFAFFSIFMPSISASHLFSSQVDFVETFSARNIFSFGDFSSILSNNLKVLLVCILSSFLFGVGTLFLFIIIWNASVIGVVFGLAAKSSALAINYSPFAYFFLILLAALPHIILEVSAYFFGGIAAGKVSALTLAKDTFSKKHRGVFKGALLFLVLSFVVLVIAAIVETVLTPYLIELLL